MTLKGGKMNQALKDWVSFVKHIQKTKNLNYKDAIIEAKKQKDNGVNWRKHSSSKSMNTMKSKSRTSSRKIKGGDYVLEDKEEKEEYVDNVDNVDNNIDDEQIGGRKHKKKTKKNIRKYKKNTRKNRKNRKH